MSLYLCSIASGSNGNCYYVGTATDAVLIDVGISCREVEKRMQQLGLSMQTVRAIFVSHEHSDHIRGLQVLAKKWNLAVYGSRGTLRNTHLQLPPQQIQIIGDESTTLISDIAVYAFRKKHDAVEPFSFTIKHHNICVGVFTDIGCHCPAVQQQFAQCHAAILESNYDEQMLDRGGYPIHLKNRIRGGWGHLSNRQALQLLHSHRSQQLTHLLLGHISKNNNCPQLVQRLFAPHAGSAQIIIAGRYAPTGVYQITAPGTQPHYRLAAPQQLALFA